MSLPPALGLLLISALWAVTWLRSEIAPGLGRDVLPPALSQALLFSVFSITAASIGVGRRAEFPRGRLAWAAAGIGVGLFVVPAALAACVQGWVSKLDQVAVFSLTPVMAVVLEPHLQSVAPRQGKGALAGGLAAVGGILLLFPLDVPGSFGAGAALGAFLAAALCVAATNCIAVRLVRSVAERSILPMAAQAGAASALCFAAAVPFSRQVEWHWKGFIVQIVWLFAVDLPGLFLLFWLMRRMAASRMTARFLLAPLFAIAGGIALEQAAPPLRAYFGMALLAGGAGWIVFAPAAKEKSEGVESLGALKG